MSATWACHGMSGLPSSCATCPTRGPYVGRDWLRAVENRGGQLVEERLCAIVVTSRTADQGEQSCPQFPCYSGGSEACAVVQGPGQGVGHGRQGGRYRAAGGELSQVRADRSPARSPLQLRHTHVRDW